MESADLSLHEGERPARRRPRYRELADQLIARIASGELEVGDRLPGELELVQQFGVSRHTVREALRVLEERGFVGRHPGIGTLVKAARASHAYVQTMSSIEEMLQYPAGTVLELADSTEVATDPELAATLGLPEGERWLRITGVRRLQDTGVAVCWSDVYVRPEYGGIVDDIGRTEDAVYRMVESRYGVEAVDVELSLTAAALSERQAPALALEAGTPALRIVRRYADRHGRVFEVSVSDHPAERFTYSLHLERGWHPSADG